MGEERRCFWAENDEFSCGHAELEALFAIEGSLPNVWEAFKGVLGCGYRLSLWKMGFDWSTLYMTKVTQGIAYK